MNIRIIHGWILASNGQRYSDGGLRVLGRQAEYWRKRYYYQNGADELIYMDAVASLYGRIALA
ncbi:MAG: hypothetical protein U0X92_18520 [Anaerolineales bacterium]